jgi:fatty acid desaturase
VKALRPHLPSGAFKADPRHLVRIVFHTVVLFGSYFALRDLSIWFAPIFSVLIGHSIACLGFLAHDVSHHAVVRNKYATRLLELFLFGVNIIPPTVWRKVHNQAHHSETNTNNDPDRVFIETERNPSTELYAQLFHPSSARKWPRALVFFHFIPYIIRNIWASILPDGHKPTVVPSKPSYTGTQRIKIFGEIIWLIALQVSIWLLMRGDWERYFWASPFALIVASSILMAYIFTNHFLNPHCEHTDPVVGSTSVIVPAWIDWLHDNFSYHTEHHVFPGMNPRHFPIVSKLLAEHFPDRYQRIPFEEAWRRLWAMDEFIQE